MTLLFNSPFISVVEIPGKGKGLIAIKDLEPKTILIKEVPFIQWSVFDPDQILASIDASARSFLQNLSPTDVKDIPKSVYEQTKRLNADFDDESIRLLYVLETNSFSRGIMTNISRCNHSCEPNSRVIEETMNDDLSKVYYTLETQTSIKAGEEILISYIDKPESQFYDDRQRLLKSTYLFECTCSRCISDLKGLVSSKENIKCKALLCSGSVSSVDRTCFKCGVQMNHALFERSIEKINNFKIKLYEKQVKRETKEKIKEKLNEIVCEDHVLSIRLRETL